MKKKPLQIEKVFGVLPKNNLKYGILKRLILVFSKTDVGGNFEPRISKQKLINNKN
jgi:hypothetical protein